MTERIDNIRIKYFEKEEEVENLKKKIDILEQSNNDAKKIYLEAENFL